MFFKELNQERYSVKRSIWFFDFSKRISCDVLRLQSMNIRVPSGNNSTTNGSWGSIHYHNLLIITFQLSNWDTTESLAWGFINERRKRKHKFKINWSIEFKQFSLGADLGVVFFSDKINLTYGVFFDGSYFTHFMPLVL